MQICSIERSRCAWSVGLAGFARPAPIESRTKLQRRRPLHARPKTHRGAAKRFKLTATGKLLRMHSGKRHLLGTKAAKRMRKLKKLTLVSKADRLKTKQMLPYAF